MWLRACWLAGARERESGDLAAEDVNGANALANAVLGGPIESVTAICSRVAPEQTFDQIVHRNTRASERSSLPMARLRWCCRQR